MLDAVVAIEPLLRVEDLSVSFRTERGLLKAVENLSFTLAPGEILCGRGRIRLRQVPDAASPSWA